MTSIFWNPEFLTVEELKSSSKNTLLTSKTDDEISDLIREWELLTLSYINYDLTIEEFDILSPLEKLHLKSAILYITENISDLWSLSSTSWIISSEKDWDRSVTYHITQSTSKNNTYWSLIPNSALALLERFKKNFYSIIL